MSKPKYTLGPWHAEVIKVDKTGDIERGIFTEAIELHPGRFKYVLLPDKYISEADMVLMAAAPELLEACKLLVALGKDPVDSETMFKFGPAYAAALEAIAKAEGDEE